MMGFGKLAVLGAALAVLSACEVADNAVKPSLTGNPPNGTDAAKSSPAPGRTGGGDSERRWFGDGAPAR